MNPPDAKKRRQMESIEDDESEVSVVNTEFEFPDDILNEEEEDETMDAVDDSSNPEAVTESLDHSSDQSENNAFDSEFMALIGKYQMLQNSFALLETWRMQFQKLLECSSRLKSDPKTVIVEIKTKNNHLRINARFKEPQDFGELRVIVNYTKNYKSYTISNLATIGKTYAPVVLLDLPLNGNFKIESIYLAICCNLFDTTRTELKSVYMNGVAALKTVEAGNSGLNTVSEVIQTLDSSSSSEEEKEKPSGSRSDSNGDEVWNFSPEESAISLAAFADESSDNDEIDFVDETILKIRQLFSFKMKIY